MSFEEVYNRLPVSGADYDPNDTMCQDDYEYYTGAGAYAEKKPLCCYRAHYNEAGGICCSEHYSNTCGYDHG